MYPIISPINPHEMVVLILFLLVESQFDVFWSFLLGRIAMLKVDTLGRGARGPVVSIRHSDGAGACPLRCHQMWPGKSHVKHGEKTWENMGRYGRILHGNFVRKSSNFGGFSSHFPPHKPRMGWSNPGLRLKHLPNR
jgi:hypothetical protein